MARVEAVRVVLEEAIRGRLERMAASVKAEVRTASRARIVLAAARGDSNAAIAREEGVSVNTVRKWRSRFADKGEIGLQDAWRPGRPRIYGPQVRVAVVATATSLPPGPESTWSHRAIADSLPEVAISASQVGRILADCELKPHRVRGWLTRRDKPDFWARAMDVCSLYLAPPEGAVVLSIDEKTAIAVRSRKHPGRPARPGRPGRQEFEYVRHGTLSIVAALDVRTGEILTEPIAKNDSATIVGFLQMLEQTIDPRRQIHVVMDNGSSHTAQHTREWLAAHPRWHVHFTPAHASWLNQVELYFSALTRRVLRYGDFPTRDELIAKIDGFGINYNLTAKPYRWTYEGTPLKAA
jgi:transposase